MRFIFFISLVVSFLQVGAQKNIVTDVLVIGGGTGGTAAGIQAARTGARTIIMEPTPMLGGMLTAAGVSCTDGNHDLPSGLWEEFRQTLYQHYGSKQLNTGWVSNTCFEPQVGDSIFKAWAAQEKNLKVFYGWSFQNVLKKGKTVTGAIFRNTSGHKMIVRANVTIDATELGDVFANAGALYDVGFDDPSETGEQQAPGKADIIQDLTWTAVLKDYGDKHPVVVKPRNYDASKYYCCNTDAPCAGKPWNGDKLKMLNYGRLKTRDGSRKYMLNWPVHGNDYYLNLIEDDPFKRQQKYERARLHTLGFVYFIQTELGMNHLGLADDELDGGLALMPYHREGRRVKGIERLTVNHITDPYQFALYRTGIAVGNYPIDHHHDMYPGEMPAISYPKIPAYNIPLGCLIPKDIDGLVVCEKGISVTNLVNGTTRLQPVVLLTGQAAGVLAARAALNKQSPVNIPVTDVQNDLLHAKCYLMPFSDVKPDDVYWESIQRIGITGILKGHGRAQGWENKMYFYPDSSLTENEFMEGFQNYLRSVTSTGSNRPLSIHKAYSIVLFALDPPKQQPGEIRVESLDDVYEKEKQTWERLRLTYYTPDRPIKRKELAVLINHFLKR